ncbi:MAG: tetratricopeptide repeat protein [Taibaiella sp.]|nr:tetratricopeptide repeat protein [Taibaiella sp.]
MKNIAIKNRKKYTISWLLGVMMLALSFVQDSAPAYSQSQKPLDIARHYAANGQPDSALPAYKMAYNEAPFDLKVYHEFYEFLLEYKKLDEAEHLVKYMQEIRRGDAAIWMDLAQVYELKGDKKAKSKIIDRLFEGLDQMSDFDIKKNGQYPAVQGSIRSCCQII